MRRALPTRVHKKRKFAEEGDWWELGSMEGMEKAGGEGKGWLR